MMKYLKTFESKIKSETDLMLIKYAIRNYTINSDGTIDVRGNVNLSGYNLLCLPFRFGKVTGYFDCSFNKLSSVIGSPTEVGLHFDCSNNRINSLNQSPHKIGSYFNCSENNLVNLEGSPKEIIGGYYCLKNNLSSLKGSPEIMNSNFNCSNNKLKSLEYCPSEIKGNFNCSNNQLLMLDCNSNIHRDLYCTNMFMTSPKFIGNCKGEIHWRS